MRATAMRLVVLIPDWNSLDSVRHAHNVLEAVALVFFALLVLFDVLAHFSEDTRKERLLEKIGLLFFAVAVFAEIAAYPYGQRNDALSEQIIGSLDTKARDAFTNASSALTKAGEADIKADQALGKVDAANTAASKAFGLAAKANAELADRTLTDQQFKSIVKQLNGFVGQEYAVTAYWDSKESLGIANRIHNALRVAGWSYNPEGSKSMMLGGIIGVFVWTHPDADGRTKEAASALVSALLEEGIAAAPRTQNPQNNPKHNKISLSVGAKR